MPLINLGLIIIGLSIILFLAAFLTETALYERMVTIGYGVTGNTTRYRKAERRWRRVVSPLATLVASSVIASVVGMVFILGGGAILLVEFLNTL